MAMSEATRWIADRMALIESSGIRKVMELGRSLQNPIDLSIGQPDFDVPQPIKEAAKRAIDAGDNRYTLTQGIPELRLKIEQAVRTELGQPERALFITSGTSGGLVLALLCTVNPGDEVIVFDPFFVMYPHLVNLAGGHPVFVDLLPDFGVDVDRVKRAITPRTKAILVNSPANPTGRVLPPDQVRDLAKLADEKGVLLISDEIYRAFQYDAPFVGPAQFNPNVLVIDGFSKSYGMTGWRLGFAHGPAAIIQEMVKLQQFSFVCAPSMVQYAGVVAWDHDVTSYVDAYRKKRDRIHAGLKDHYEVAKPEGAFYIFPRAPGGNGVAFVEEAIRNRVLIIPGKVFSRHDTHFRISYAVDDAMLERGIEALQRLARGR
jgi:aspartate aminotransferase/aminotransferase